MAYPDIGAESTHNNSLSARWGAAYARHALAALDCVGCQNLPDDLGAALDFAWKELMKTPAADWSGLMWKFEQLNDTPPLWEHDAKPVFAAMIADVQRLTALANRDGS